MLKKIRMTVLVYGASNKTSYNFLTLSLGLPVENAKYNFSPFKSAVKRLIVWFSLAATLPIARYVPSPTLNSVINKEFIFCVKSEKIKRSFGK